MNKMKSIHFVLLVIVLSWGPWFIAIAAGCSVTSTMGVVCVGLGSLGPTVSALLMLNQSTKHTQSSYWRRIIDVSIIPRKMWSILVLGMPIIALFSVGLAALTGHSVSSLFPVSFTQAYPHKSLGLVLMILACGAVFEELGWRGYWLDSLGKHFSLFTVSIIIGGVWALWHVPLLNLTGYLLQSHLTSSIKVMVFFVNLLPLSIILTWIYCCTNRSILAVIIFHFFINLTGSLIRIDAATEVIQMVLLFLCASVILVQKRTLFFSPPILRDALMQKAFH